MRNLHRWIMVIFAITLTYFAASGTILAIYDYTDSDRTWSVDGGGWGPTAEPGLTDTQLRTVGQNIVTALNGHPGALMSLSLRQKDNGLTTEATFAATGTTPSDHVTIDTDRATIVTSDVIAPNAPRVSTLHDQIKKWHRGNIIGVTGIFIGFFTGIALLLMSISGLILYAQMWSMRRNSGRPALVWGGGDTWRLLHRQISIVACVILAYVAVTGMLLDINEIQSRLVGFPGGMLRGGAPMSFNINEITPALLTSHAAAQRLAPESSVSAISIANVGGQLRGSVLLAGYTAGTIRVDAHTGTHLSGPAGSPGPKSGLPGTATPYHQLLKRLHRGDVLGFNGRALDIATGIAFLYLCISGMVMYSRLWKRRRALGRPALFWS
ncbi:MAG: PepSY-associated TM helix domain-containing protein [Steroidobacteraceae bacterium]